MKIKTKIKKFGNSAVVVLPAESMRLDKLKVGDVVDVEITKEKKQ